MNTYPELQYITNRALDRLISTVAKRAHAQLVKQGLDYPYWQLLLDLEITHCNGCELDLVALANASQSDFAHDISGIVRHLNRTTGRLGGCFLPRYAYVNHSAAALVNLNSI